LPKIYVEFGLDVNEQAHLYLPNSKSAATIVERTTFGELSSRDLEIKKEELKQPPEPAPAPKPQQSPRPDPKQKKPKDDPQPPTVALQRLNSGQKTAGLENAYNSCYINAALQCLFWFPDFLQTLATADGPLTVLWLHLRLRRAMPKPLIRNHSKMIFAAIYLNLRTGINRMLKSSYRCFSTVLHSENQEIIERYFYGSMESEITCEFCHRMMSRIEDFTTLPLSISGFRHIVYSPWDAKAPIECKRSCVWNTVQIWRRRWTGSGSSLLKIRNCWFMRSGFDAGTIKWFGWHWRSHLESSSRLCFIDIANRRSQETPDCSKARGIHINSRKPGLCRSCHRWYSTGQSRFGFQKETAAGRHFFGRSRREFLLKIAIG